MPEITVNVGVRCGGCGNDLGNQTDSATTRSGQVLFTVEPCTNCLEAARQEGYDNGQDDGYASGMSAAKEV